MAGCVMFGFLPGHCLPDRPTLRDQLTPDRAAGPRWACGLTTGLTSRDLARHLNVDVIPADHLVERGQLEEHGNQTPTCRPAEVSVAAG